MDCLPLLLYLTQLMVYCQGWEDDITKVCKVEAPTSKRQIVKLGNNYLMCDTKSDAHIPHGWSWGWVIFQRRINGDVSFERNWQDYTEGFGHFDGDFWLGLENLHILCNSICQFRVDFSIKGWYYTKRNKYYKMSLSGASDNYRLNLSDHWGQNTGGYDLTDNKDLTVNGMAFTTADRDNDKHPGRNCAARFRSGWWWNKCGLTNLNGVWDSDTYPTFMLWESVTGKQKHNSVAWSELKVKVLTNMNKGIDLKTSHLALPARPTLTSRADKVGSGDKIILTCKTTTDTSDVYKPFEYQFFKDGVVVQTKSDKATFTIESAQVADHNGKKYTCIAYSSNGNVASDASKELTLTVAAKCKPGWQHIKSKCYKNLKKRTKYVGYAKRMCRDEGAMLPEPNTEDELGVLVVPERNPVITYATWIGATRLGDAGFVWNSNQNPISILPWRWYPGRGPDSERWKTCVQTGISGKLKAKHCFSNYHMDVVCSYDNNCYDAADKGKGSYRGIQNTTKDGKTCQKWSSQTPHQHNMATHWRDKVNPDHNFCRNPDGRDSPWCFTTDPATKWQYCGVPTCWVWHSLAGDCYDITDKGKVSYKGRKSITIGGRVCQKWSKQFPHKHSMARHWPDKVNPDHNFCRNPDGKDAPWCFTEWSYYRWEYCGVPACWDWRYADCYDRADKGKVSYRGMKSDTRGWKTCQKWSSNTPHNHSQAANWPDKVNPDHNFCRNPDGKDAPWCYTMWPDTRWQYCGVPACSAQQKRTSASEGTMCRFSVLSTAFSMLFSMANVH